MDTSALGNYLHAKRELTQPADVGLAADNGRRVRGLRREEVATLAGISPEYYLRLEQGRDVNPSEQVLDALGRAFQLDEEEIGYLHRLVRPPRRRSVDPLLDESLLDFVYGMTDTPAFIANTSMDIVAANPMVLSLSAGAHAVGHNLLIQMFEPVTKSMLPDWELVASRAIANFRSKSDPNSPRVKEIVAQMTTLDADFLPMWAKYEVSSYQSDTVSFYLAPVGFFTVRFINLDVPGHAGYEMTTFFADPGSPGETALALHKAELAAADL